MKPKTAIVVTTIAALALTGTALSTSSAQQSEPSQERLELRMSYREAKVTLVDNPPRMTKRRPSESPGDMAVSRGVLRDASGARVGTLHSIFTVTAGRSPRTSELSTGAFTLKGGQITGQGVVLNRPRRGPDRDVLPVTGGSGRYDGVRGTVAATTGKRGVTFVFDLRR